VRENTRPFVDLHGAGNIGPYPAFLENFLDVKAHGSARLMKPAGGAQGGHPFPLDNDASDKAFSSGWGHR